MIDNPFGPPNSELEHTKANVKRITVESFLSTFSWILVFSSTFVLLSLLVVVYGGVYESSLEALYTLMTAIFLAGVSFGVPMLFKFHRGVCARIW